MENLFLTNYSKITFVDKFKDCIRKCKSFSFSVSFIKKAGLCLLDKEIVLALERGVKGKIIVSTYQNFTDIMSLNDFLNWMNQYPNFECHLEFNSFDDNGFHSKGYLFEYDDSYEFIVGSTNITRFALLKNVEWNVALKGNEMTGSVKDVYDEFDYLWNKTSALTGELIKKYQLQLNYAIERWDMDYVEVENNINKPNLMQQKALKELRRYRDMGIKKALVVAATGSGKTFLAAFDARSFNAKRVLFVVHRDKILVDAKSTFMKVFGAEKSYGLFVGKNKDSDADFIFASNIMLSEHLDYFNKDEFDYIVMDECHHAAASSYKKIMSYFTPEFCLGITATPERMDNKDVFELFDKNVPYELRLKDAIINDLVVPFHYYGIRDKLADYSFDDPSKISKEIAKEVNVNFIVSEIEKHRPKNKLKALAFCTSIAHAKLMSDEFELRGYNSVSLTGSADIGQRVKAFNDLQDESSPLEIICAVDILNEGVDIPGVNMVLFLRPTESSTVFLQQLGRGLRKADGKDYVTVLDFIGNNYDRSVQIAMALGSLGNASIIEKPYLKDLINNSFAALKIPGVVIDIDELSKEDIIAYLDSTNFNKKEFLKKDYENFKIYLKKEEYPAHMDYLNTDAAPNLIRFLKSKVGGKSRSYYSFLRKIGEENLPLFDDDQIKLIDSFEDYLPIVRIDEYIIVREILEDSSLDLSKLVNTNAKVTIETLNHALNHLKEDKIVTDDNKLNASRSEIFKEYLEDVISYGLQRYDTEFSEYDGEFKLYGNYYSEQIQTLRLRSNSAYMRGTEFDTKDKKTYCYVTLHKEANKEERLKYKDKFKDSKTFIWESVRDTTLTTGDGPKLLATKEVYLFIRKLKEEDTMVMPYTYFGKGKFKFPVSSHTGELDEKTGTEKDYPTLIFEIELDNKVPEEMWFDFDIEEKTN